MSETLTQDAYKEIISMHGLWLASDGEEGRRANFRGADLTDIRFGKADLRGANFRGTNLHNCDLRTVTLDDADFSEADLRYANLTEASCVHTNFNRANLEHAYLHKISASEALFQQANCSFIDARNAQLTNANMREANLKEANFSFAQLSGVTLRGAKADETIFTHADLSHADCNDAHFTGTTFIDTLLEQTSVRRASFIDVSFGDADFSNCQHLDPALFTHSASSTKKGLQTELDTLQRQRDTLEKARDELEEDKSMLVKTRMRLQDLWREETLFNEHLSKRIKGIQRGAMAFIALGVTLVVLGSYQGAIIGFKQLLEGQGQVIIALWVAFVVLSLFAGVQLYRVASLTVRHLQGKADLLSQDPPLVSTDSDDETSGEQKDDGAEVIEFPDQRDGKIEYY